MDFPVFQSCGAYAFCEFKAGTAACKCPKGWTGDPNVKCGELPTISVIYIHMVNGLLQYRIIFYDCLISKKMRAANGN